MVEVETGITILDLQIQNLIRHIPMQLISVVGFMKKKVQAAHPELQYICNQRYDTTNTGASCGPAQHFLTLSPLVTLYRHSLQYKIFMNLRNKNFFSKQPTLH